MYIDIHVIYIIRPDLNVCNKIHGLADFYSVGQELYNMYNTNGLGFFHSDRPINSIPAFSYKYRLTNRNGETFPLLE